MPRRSRLILINLSPPSLRKIPRRNAGVGVGNARRHRSLDPATLLRLLPGVRENADRARQDEEPASERRREAQFGIDDGRGAVDVHRNLASLALLHQRLDAAADIREAAGYHGALARG